MIGIGILYRDNSELIISPDAIKNISLATATEIVFFNSDKNHSELRYNMLEGPRERVKDGSLGLFLGRKLQGDFFSPMIILYGMGQHVNGIVYVRWYDDGLNGIEGEQRCPESCGKFLHRISIADCSNASR